MPGVYKTQKIKELGNVCKLGTLRDRQFPQDRVASLVRRHYYPKSIKNIENSFVISHDKDGNKIDNKHRLYQLLNKKCTEFESKIKNKYSHKLVRIVNHAHLTARDKDGIVIGNYETSILNNGGSDFLNLNKKEEKEVNEELDKFKGELERYFNDISWFKPSDDFKLDGTE